MTIVQRDKSNNALAEQALILWDTRYRIPVATKMKFASIAFYILAFSFILWYSEAFVVRRLVVSPALSTNKQLWTTAPPQHARVTALGLWDRSKVTNKQGARKAPQHARITALRDHKGLLDVVVNSIPAVLLAIRAQASLIAQDKAIAAEKENLKATIAQDKIIAAEKAKIIAAEMANWKATQEKEKAIAAERERQDKVLAAERESPKEAIAAKDKVIDAGKAIQENAIAADRERQDKAIAAERERQDKAIAADRERQDKAIAAEREIQDKAIAVQEKAIAA